MDEIVDTVDSNDVEQIVDSLIHYNEAHTDVLLERSPNLRVDPDTKLEPIPSEGIHGVTMLPVLF